VPSVTDVQITGALVTLIHATLPQANVYPWIRYPANGREDSFLALFRSPTSNDLTVWMVTRLSETPTVDGFDNVISVLDTWRILGIRGLVDTDEYETTSAAIFQGEVNSVRSAINADPTLGFGQCNASHKGFKIVSIVDGLFAGLQSHIAECRLPVDLFST
jgi:hypothetical protein